ncbi:MAG TPA: FlgO family outer membrane protein, partial [Acidobacteriota bacterium]|nr:FlgO family outer membrane protein [Acidobacteriota bacterium]
VGYMSPEQIRGAVLDGRSDIFSFGCILYEMLTGNRAFSRETVYETVAAILKEEPEDLAHAAKKAPMDLQRLVHHCLEKNPDERAHSAHDLAFDLRTILASTHSSGLSTVPAFNRSSWGLWTTLILFLFVIGLTVALIFLPRKNLIHSIAVLPFINVKNDPNTEYLSDGMTESLINNLAQIPNLRVMARSTVFRYKGTPLDLEKIRKDLDVEAVLTGTLVQQGDLLTIKTELIKVKDGSLLWGENYNQRYSDILPIQEEISSEILRKLRLTLTGEQQQRFSRRQPENTEAYRLYLLGLYYSNKRTAEGLNKGNDYFQQAIEKDPGYALAYTGLAYSYGLMGGYDILAPKDAFAKAKSAAIKALEIDEELAEAHTTLGQVYTYYWEFKNAEKEFKRALELNPGLASAHAWYSTYLVALGRLKESLLEIEKAVELDPLSVSLLTARAWRLVYIGRYDEAIDQAQKALELDSHFAPAHGTLAAAYLMKKRYPEALSEYKIAHELSRSSDTLSEVAYVNALIGNREEAVRILNELRARSVENYVSPVQIALIYIGLNQKDDAIEWLRNAYDVHAEYLSFVGRDPRFNTLHSHQQFQEIFQKIGLPLE